MPGDFRVSPSTGRYEVPHYSIKLCTYDPAIIAAFARLRKNRKQAEFTHEALKNFKDNDTYSAAPSDPHPSKDARSMLPLLTRTDVTRRGDT